MNSPVPTTASQRVLSSPELVASIIDWLVVDSYARPEQNQSSRLPILLRDRQTLIQCACVNVTLWTQVMRRFWLHVPDIALQLSIIDPARCQLYADLIQTGNLIQIKRGLKKARAALSGVTFPRLHVLRLVLRLRDPDFKFPSVSAPILRTMVIKASDYGMSSRRRVDGLASYIKKSYPQIENILIEVDTRVSEKSLQTLSESLSPISVSKSSVSDPYHERNPKAIGGPSWYMHPFERKLRYIQSLSNAPV